MGLLDILGGGGSNRGGISPLTLALMGVLAYRTMKGQGRLANVLGMNPKPKRKATAMEFWEAWALWAAFWEVQVQGVF